MAHLNIEIKARCTDPDDIRRVLRERGADFRGEDHQVDTYFRSPRGRLKLREGSIEHSLIHYHRPDQAGPKRSDVVLCPTGENAAPLKETLAAAMGIRVVVDKHREIYFINNVKFHIDSVAGVGSFVEIEAIDTSGDLGSESLQAQCEHYMDLLGIAETDLVDRSYSDMM